MPSSPHPAVGEAVQASTGARDPSTSSAPKRPSVDVEPQTPRLRPRKKKKKTVRFSDPGPPQKCLGSHPGASTGLTPQISRARISAGGLESPPNPTRGKQGKRRTTGIRRHSAPVPQIHDDVMVESSPSLGSYQKFQYLPMHDCLTPRTVRSIRRFRLSEEMNRIEEQRKAQKRREREREEELARLRDELNRLKTARLDGPDDVDDDDWREGQSLPVCRNLLGSFTAAANEPDGAVLVPDGIESDTDSVMTDNDGPSGVSVRDTPITTFPATPTDASAQASLPDLDQEATLKRLHEELEQRKLQEQRLFRGWQAVLHAENTATGSWGPEEPPPPDLTEKVIATLSDAASRASDAARALQNVYHELSSHGFDGADAMEVINKIGARFRRARIELERAVPGETSQADLSNWRDIIEALVQKIERLVRDLHDAREQLTGAEDRERALRHQFNAALVRLDEATKKSASVEQYQESVAEDMLHARLKLQSLEKEMEAHEADKRRLQDALDKYREDVAMLEKLNAQLENDLTRVQANMATLQRQHDRLAEDNESHKQAVLDLQGQLLHEQEEHRKTQSFLEQRTLEIETLRAEIQRLETEKDQIIAALRQAAEQQSHDHEREIGALNARLATVTTSLDEALEESRKLAADKARLQRQLNDFQRLFSREAIQAAHAQALETAQALAEWQQGLSLMDNGGDTEPDDDDDHDGEEDRERTKHSAVQNRYSFSALGGEPITPGPECRFKNVVCSRGKKRRPPGTGVMETVEEEEDEGSGRTTT
ncbi:hypothetical protein VTO42DRAFT_4274 [Malbranchea cinnamomea]